MSLEDGAIVELFWQRDESAIAAVSEKYGAYCRTIALNLLGSREDAEECLNDTWHQAWQHIPPQRPAHLRPWLGKVVRCIAMNLYSRSHAVKRGGMDRMLEELDDSVPGGTDPEQALEAAELGEAISRWLKSLPKEDRVLFVRRYWYGEELRELAKERNTDPARLAQKMLRLRRSLRRALEQEGISL